jgi:hypothetical protein
MQNRSMQNRSMQKSCRSCGAHWLWQLSDLAELSCRFKHREQDLFSLLYKAMSDTNVKAIEPILVRSA